MDVLVDVCISIAYNILSLFGDASYEKASTYVDKRNS